MNTNQESVNQEKAQFQKEIKEQDNKAREFYGSLNYAFIQLDQPRGWKGFMAKGAVNGLITAGCVAGVLELRDHIKKRKNGKLLTIAKGNNQRAQ